jgi:hypothetical protein
MQLYQLEKSWKFKQQAWAEVKGQSITNISVIDCLFVRRNIFEN